MSEIDDPKQIDRKKGHAREFEEEVKD